MKISAKAEYGCIAMLELAANFREPQPQRVKVIAESHDIPQRFLVQILLQLKSAGLVVSVRGALGGYQLARPPEKISLAQVINAIDRTPMARPVLSPTNLSPTAHVLHDVWKEIQTAEQRALEAHSLAELVRRAQQAHAISYQI
jgi:Rrf2 family protein